MTLTSRGAGRRWLDVTLNGGNAVLICFYEPYHSDFQEFSNRVNALGGFMAAAATEVREGMTAVVMQDGKNYAFIIESVTLG